MEIKKSPNADLENKKTLFFEIGLVVALAIAGLAFAFSSEPVPEPYSPSVQEVPQEELDMMVRVEEEAPKPQQQEQQKVQAKVLADKITIVENTQKIEVEAIITEDASMFDDFSFDVDVVEEEESSEDDIFTILEDPATFQGGGLADFRKWVREELRYPQIAQENGIQGNVTIEFVVDEKGKIGRFKVLQSPDPILSDAAIKTLEKSNSLKRGWKPGKQRGKAVKQKFILPVSFKLVN